MVYTKWKFGTRKLIVLLNRDFGVEWDDVNKVINLTSKTGYKKVGGELSIGETRIISGIENKSLIYKDGGISSLKSYTINGYNYFKLRDLGSDFNFGIEFDAKLDRITIETTKDYVAPAN